MGRNRKRLYVGVVVGMVAAAAISTGVYASVRGGSDGVPATAGKVPNGSISITNCKTPKSDFITNDTTGLGTTSTTHVAVPGMTKTITIAGNVASCVIVDVSAFAFAPGGGLEYVAVTLDGNFGNPTEVQLAGDTKG